MKRAYLERLDAIGLLYLDDKKHISFQILLAPCITSLK